jgi:hypothetical protein
MWKIFKHREKVVKPPIPTNEERCIIGNYFIGWEAKEVKHNEMYGSQVTKSFTIKGIIVAFDRDTDSVKIKNNWYSIDYNTLGCIYKYIIIKQ